MKIPAQSTVREIVIENPAAARVFEGFGIDYCCGGKRPLSEACKSAGVDTEAVLNLLNGTENSEGSAPAPLENWSTASLSALTRHIVEHHHTFVRTETRRLVGLFGKVVSRHGAAHPELAKMYEILTALHDDLAVHMLKEERILFPYVDALDAGEAPEACFDSVLGPISVLTAEHETDGRRLAQMRELSSGYTVPENACPTYRALYHGLQELERDLHQHIHLENNILFPRAAELEAKQPTAPSAEPQPAI